MEEPRGCKPEELDAVVELCNRVFRSGSGDMGSEYPLLFHPDNAHRLRTIWEGQKVVSHAGFVVRDCWILGASFRAAMVGAVCTDAEFRGQGMASATMADVQERAMEEDCQLMLVSGSRKLYRRMGCVHAGRFDGVRIPLDALPGRSQAGRPADLPDLRALVGIYQAEPVRFERSVDDWELMLDCGMLMNAPAQLCVVEEDGEITAYAGVRPAGDDGVARVLEYGGSRTALLENLRALCAGANAVEIVQMPADQEIRRLSKERGDTLARGFAGTIKILDLPAFFDRAQSLLYERLGDEASGALGLSVSPGGLTFEWEGQVLDVAQDDVPPLVFGPAPDHSPFPTVDPPLDEILRTLFPLPLLWYGYNYV